MEQAFFRTARYYDKMYAQNKDYHAEVRRLLALLGTDFSSTGKRLLDVACGTGMHILHLKEHFQVEGLDICEGLLEVAKRRNPDVSFHQGDMTGFDLGHQFDIVTCLFSSIGYAKTLDMLQQALHCMACHVASEGILVIEPWFTPDNWYANTVHGLYVDEPELKIARISTSFVDGRISVFDLHHLIGTPHGTEYVVEHHELGLFEIEEMQSAMEKEGFSVEYDPDGLTERGLFIGRRIPEASH